MSANGACTNFGDTNLSSLISTYSDPPLNFQAICNGKYKAAVPVVKPTGPCGNGKVDPGESCDQGSLNGLACSPEYGKSCTYCANDCKKVLTVDTPNYCGNDSVEPNSPEVCEVINGQVRILATSTAYKTDADGKVTTSTLYGNQLKECYPNQKGAYQCSADCRTLSNLSLIHI